MPSLPKDFVPFTYDSIIYIIEGKSLPLAGTLMEHFLKGSA